MKKTLEAQIKTLEKSIAKFGDPHKTKQPLLDKLKEKLEERNVN